MNLSVLEKIGLSKAEIKVYLTLLELGSTPSARLVHETGFRKSTVYDSISRLRDKGLVSHIIRDSRKYFEAASPDRLVDFLHDRKRVLDEYEEEVCGLLRDLKKGFTLTKPHAEAHVFMGIEGFKTMRRDSLRNAGKEILLMGAIVREPEVLPVFYTNWNISRIAKKISFKLLVKKSGMEKQKKWEKLIGRYYEARLLPEEFESPAVINIYGDRVVDVLWKGGEPICFMLINRDISDAYRQYFNYLWKRAKR